MFQCRAEMILIQLRSDIQMGLNTWAQLRRTIAFVRGQTESLRHIYLDLDSGTSGIPGAITSDPQDATNPSVMHPPGNVHLNSPNIIRALDEVLSELRTLEIEYMLEQHPSNVGRPELNIPFLLRLKFQIKGKRDLKTILAELERRNEDMKAMIKELREIAQWKCRTSARQMSHVEPSPTAADHITPPEVEPSFSVAGIEGSTLDAPPAGVTPLPAGGTPPPAHASMPPGAGDTTAIDNPPRSASSHAGTSLANFGHGTNTDGGEFQSAESFASYEHEDNYSTHTGDQICKQCHQVWRRD